MIHDTKTAKELAQSARYLAKVLRKKWGTRDPFIKAKIDALKEQARQYEKMGAK